MPNFVTVTSNGALNISAHTGKPRTNKFAALKNPDATRDLEARKGSYKGLIMAESLPAEENKEINFMSNPYKNMGNPGKREQKQYKVV